MPVDPIGLTLGLASLASLFTTCLDVLDRISAAKSYGSDYNLFITKVETERLRLFRWGQAVGLTDIDGPGGKKRGEGVARLGRFLLRGCGGGGTTTWSGNKGVHYRPVRTEQIEIPQYYHNSRVGGNGHA
ncbi:hypothetical protein K440DRAFT_609914 [Wilcoxina mikolae CBS 423.85]|nr:hypothetical protein K440DRAFT_609914 [Wilcoxina mikolae CBS 423.85]